MNEPNSTISKKVAVTFSDLRHCHANCKEVIESVPQIGKRPFEENWEYKVIVDLEGHGWSRRLKNLLYSNSIIFKPRTVFREFWQDSVKPWEHYIPLKADFSDTEEKLDSALAGNKTMLAVIEQSTEFIRDHLRIEDVYCYFYRLLLDYSKLVRYDMQPCNDTEVQKENK